jgi:hypothetical protein
LLLGGTSRPWFIAMAAEGQGGGEGGSTCVCCARACLCNKAVVVDAAAACFFAEAVWLIGLFAVI